MITAVGRIIVPKNGITFTQNSISSFSKVDENLYRGARPWPNELRALLEHDISTVIDFSTELPRIPNYDEGTAVRNLGMQYFRIPFASCDQPTDAQVKEFFSIVQGAKNQNEKVFAHCLHGRDRTGLMVELYRLYYGISASAEESIARLKANKCRNTTVFWFIEEFFNSVKSGKFKV